MRDSGRDADTCYMTLDRFRLKVGIIILSPIAGLMLLTAQTEVSDGGEEPPSVDALPAAETELPPD